MHLTLAFVGPVALERLPALIEAARPISAPAFALHIDQWGYWPHQRLLWAGLSRPPAALTALAGELRTRLTAANFAVDRGKNGFFPHVTLVRKVANASGLSSGRLLPPVSWSATSFVLVASERSPAGADYRILASFPLTHPEAT